MGYKILWISQIVPFLQNLILGYICVCDLKYECVRHLLGESVSDKLVAMTESPQLTTWLLVEPAGH